MLVHIIEKSENKIACLCISTTRFFFGGKLGKLQTNFLKSRKLGFLGKIK